MAEKRDRIWKRFDDISGSARHARVSLSTVGFWAYMLGIADTRGRFPAEPRRILNLLNIRQSGDLRLSVIASSLSELAAAGLIHVYAVPVGPGKGLTVDREGNEQLEQYGLIHEFERHCPTGALRYISPTYPEPPAGICTCVFNPVPPSASPSPPREAHPPPPSPRRPSPSPSSSGEEGSGEKGGKRGVPGVYGRAPEPPRVLGRKDCPTCRGEGRYQAAEPVKLFTGGSWRPWIVCPCTERETA